MESVGVDGVYRVGCTNHNEANYIFKFKATAQNPCWNSMGMVYKSLQTLQKFEKNEII